MLNQEILDKFDNIQQYLHLLFAIGDLLSAVREMPLYEDTLPCIGTFMTGQVQTCIKDLEELKESLNAYLEGEVPE